MNNLERLDLAGMEEFLTANREVTWSVVERDSSYECMEWVLKAQRYRRLSKTEKGLVGRFLAKVTGLSRAQTTRLIQR